MELPVGFAVGKNDGTAVAGVAVGGCDLKNLRDDGKFVGSGVGTGLGLLVGSELEGCNEGCCDGAWVGLPLDGAADGCEVGIDTVGAQVGTTVGNAVGASVVGENVICFPVLPPPHIQHATVASIRTATPFHW